MPFLCHAQSRKLYLVAIRLGRFFSTAASIYLIPPISRTTRGWRWSTNRRSPYVATLRENASRRSIRSGVESASLRRHESVDILKVRRCYYTMCAQTDHYLGRVVATTRKSSSRPITAREIWSTCRRGRIACTRRIIACRSS